MSDRTYTPAQMADAVQRMMDDGTYMPWDVLPKIVAYLRSPAPGAAEMREALIEVAARARMNFITTDEAWADRHQPCPMTKAVTPIADDWLARHPISAPEVPEAVLQISAVIWCGTCRSATLHERRTPDVCCTQCHGITCTEHGR